jgi:hypothetical protein
LGRRAPEQVQDNAAASGITLGDELLTKIDKILDPVIERDPREDSGQLSQDPRCLSPLHLCWVRGQFG